jgi:ATP-dependent DNA helicase RecG
MIAIFNDRMEIQSPGTLPLGMTIDDFKAGLSRIRNRVIARVFRELGLMEDWGSGYRRVSDSCTRAGYPVPEWQELQIFRTGSTMADSGKNRQTRYC